MKTNIIALAIANIVCVGFIMLTIFLRFGINIEVIKNVDAYPVAQGVSHSSIYDLRLHQTYDNYTRIVKVSTDDEDIEPVWVDAKDIFGTDSEKKIREMIEEKEIVRLNIFINPETGETIGVTKKGSTRWSLFYNNNKLLKYGLTIILCVDIFVIGLIFFPEKMKRRQK